MLGLVLGFAKEGGRIIQVNSVSWGFETPFWKTIRLKSRENMLRGRPDYALALCSESVCFSSFDFIS